jgi:hypothetical protein
MLGPIGGPFLPMASIPGGGPRSIPGGGPRRSKLTKIKILAYIISTRDRSKLKVVKILSRFEIKIWDQNFDLRTYGICI